MAQPRIFHLGTPLTNLQHYRTEPGTRHPLRLHFGTLPGGKARFDWGIGMMFLRTLAVALISVFAAIPSWGAELVAYTPPAGTRHPTSSDLIHTIGLDNVFVQFGRSIAISPRQRGIADPRFLEAWETSALLAFSDGKLNARLEASLAQTLSSAELSGVDSFLTSSFGQRVIKLEQASQAIAADQQIAALAKGQTLYWTVSERRKAQFGELLSLSGAEMTFAVIGESLRGMALGLHLAAGGEIETPWEEIDNAVKLQLGGMKESLAEAAYAALAYTYNDLTDAELEDYLVFLRTPAARKFYDTATLAVGDIIRQTMFGLGESVALNMRRVDI